MTWDAPSGRVGINTTSPSEKLDVNGSAKVQGSLEVTGPTKYKSLSGVGASWTTFFAISIGEIYLVTGVSTDATGVILAYVTKGATEDVTEIRYSGNRSFSDSIRINSGSVEVASVNTSSTNYFAMKLGE